VKEDEVSRRLATIFEGELQDHARSIERDLLAIERGPEPAEMAELCNSLLRSAHSLKGAANVVGAQAIEAACHRLEEVFQALRDGRLAPERTLFQTLLAVVDSMRQAHGGSERGGDVLRGRLSQLDADPSETAGDPSPQPPSRAAIAAPRGEEGVRIAATKLDSLLAQSEQLLVARRRADLQDGALAELRNRLGPWLAQWSELEQSLAKALPIAEPSRPGAGEDAADLRRRRRIRRALTGHAGDLRRIAQDLRGFGTRLGADRRALDQAATALDADIRRVRMMPFATVCDRFDRVSRDLTEGGDKQARVVVAGGDVELDRSVLEGLRDPLLHLVRNAIDHGVEPVTERRRAGKSAVGEVAVTARLRGMQVEIDVADDGRGIDLAVVEQEAQRRGLGATARPPALVDHLFQPGFSTSRSVTAVSGRGVGLDVVKSQVEAMRGSVDVVTELGRGTRFRLTLPLTLTTIRGLLVRAGGNTFAVDAASVRRLLRVTPEDIRSVDGWPMITGQGPPTILVSLASSLGFDPAGRADERAKIPVVILVAGGREVAFAVDELVGEQELLVRNLGARLRRVRHVAGGTILPSGRIALILHAGDLVQGALALREDQRFPTGTAAGAQPARRHVVVADDSVTTRTLMKAILEGAGYDVVAVADGMEAWRSLQDTGADLLVSDVEMPRMDGFALTETVRGSPHLRDLPVILMTSRESEADKARGLHAGANAYLVKSAFDQRVLLSTIEQLL